MRENGYRAVWQFVADYVHHFCFTKNWYPQGRRSAISTGGKLRLKTRAGDTCLLGWGVGGILSQKILKSRGSEMVFSTFSMRYFSKKSQPSWIRCKMTGTSSA